MKWTFDERVAPEFIRITLSGRYIKKDFSAMIDELAALESFEMGCRILVDNTSLDVKHMSDHDLLGASNAFIDNNKVFAYSKVAIVTTPKGFDFGRKFEQITEFGSRAILKIFSDESAALSWLVGSLALAQSAIS